MTEEDKKDLRRLLNLGDIIDVDSKIALKAGELRALSRKNYKRKLKLPDALVAATAIMCSGTLVTRNTDDFKHLSKHGLCLYNPFVQSETVPNDTKTGQNNKGDIGRLKP
ncbi:PIN domain [Moorella glycerini]|uniref:PIN domain protein n=1 Tax=Neomoorella stamsii TaxID=1266720 RepID=A0A9X7P7D7_9FIRM|nr:MULTISPECIES: type II toxin-antitoxin system VapC family toxin [Moorella]PRR77057.1 PIN domain protein [Moorella stamsii]CEP68832.1 PIN domain [Moorella glycerini]